MELDVCEEIERGVRRRGERRRALTCDHQSHRLSRSSQDYSHTNYKNNE